MSAAGNSASRQGAAIRAHARRGLWRRLLSAVGVTVHTRRADAQAAAWSAGGIGETRTVDLLRPLDQVGWTVLHDRRIPGARKANADHVLVSPGARVFLVDSKLWSRRYPVHVQGGVLWHGKMDRSRAVRTVLWEADMVSRALGVPVQALIGVHNAQVAGGGFIVQDVPVVPAVRLVELLLGNDGPRREGARWLGRLAADRLPPYVGSG